MPPRFDSDDHLQRYLVYIDLKMVRAQVGLNTPANGRIVVTVRFKNRESAIQ